MDQWRPPPLSPNFRHVNVTPMPASFCNTPLELPYLLDTQKELRELGHVVAARIKVVNAQRYFPPGIFIVEPRAAAGSGLQGRESRLIEQSLEIPIVTLPHQPTRGPLSGTRGPGPGPLRTEEPKRHQASKLQSLVVASPVERYALDQGRWLQ